MVFPCIPTCNYMKQWGTKVGVYSRGGHLFDISKTTKIAQAQVQLVVFEKLQVLICMRKHVNTC